MSASASPFGAEEPSGRPQTPADLRLLAAALAAWAVLALTLPVDPARRAVGIVVALLVAGALRARPRLRSARHSRPHATPLVLGLLGATVVLLQVGALGHQLLRATGPLPDLVRERAVVTLTGTVATDPRPITSGRGQHTVLVRVDADSVTGRGHSGTASGPVLVRGGDDLARLRWGATVTVTGRLSPMAPADPEVAALRVTAAPVVRAPPGVIAAGAERLREGLRRSVAGLPDDARGLVPGLVIGDTSHLPPGLDDAMRATGMTHLTAVSGSNVSVILALAFAAARALGLRRRLRPWVALVVLAGFVVLARPEPSVLRAATMGAIGVLGLSRHRRSAGLPVLGGAILVVLLVDPWLSRSYGFALSTLATLGLLVLAGPWGESIGSALARAARGPVRAARRPLRSAPAPLRQHGPTWSGLGSALAIPVAAQVVCAPVLVLLQSSITVVGVLANLLAAPLVPVTTIGGVVVAGVALVWPTGAGWLAWLPGLPALGIARIGRVCADLPLGSIPWPGGAAGAVGLAALTVLALLLGRSVADLAGRRPVGSVAVVGVVAALLVPTRVVTWPPPDWVLVSCDVGQGDATVLRTGPHRAIVVDVGPDPALVDRCLDRLGVQTVDAVILTHFHLDHVGGLDGVTRGRTVGTLLTTWVAEPEDMVLLTTTWAGREHVPIQSLHAGDTLHFGTVTAQVWWPARRIDAGSIPNNASLVLATQDDGVKALLLGDLEREAGAALLSRIRRDQGLSAEAAAFDVVKSPHHGSANIDPALMAAVRAPLAIISVGADNDYGHPAPAHLTLLHNLGYGVRRTDLAGDIAVTRGRGVTRVVTQR